MKSLTLFIILTSFIALSLLGFIAMHAVSDHLLGCLASRSAGVDCPRSKGIFTLLNFHLNAFKQFSQATLMLFFAAFAYALLRITVLAALPGNFQLATARSFSPQTRKERAHSPIIRTLQHWLALREKRDPALFV